MDKLAGFGKGKGGGLLEGEVVNHESRLEVRWGKLQSAKARDAVGASSAGDVHGGFVLERSGDKALTPNTRLQKPLSSSERSTM